MKFIGIIPARYGSSRFPGKPLAKLGGRCVIEWVYSQAKKVLDDVVVATDDERIYDEVKRFGGKVEMTSSNHKSGTDRCWEAYQKAGRKADVVINIQGDEPFIQPEQIEGLMKCFDDAGTDIATMVKPFEAETKYEVLENPNCVKCVRGEKGEALYFSRSVVPYLRGIEKDEWSSRETYYKHLGIYAYKVSVLEQVVEMPQGRAEKIESLEQLRWLENGLKIKTAVTNTETVGIDTPEDLINAEKYLERTRSRKSR